MSRDASTTLLVRAWLEDDERFRARLTSGGRLSGVVLGEDVPEDVPFAVAASRRQVIDATREWLDDLVSGARR